ncbi:Protein of unknown function [Oribacterium sp. KHPX15]|uniref:DUF4446 family protein n=1 Tax=unclassified Oribacterium TaxID=2629782 RepID=UPI00089BFF27|nr:MULTISPECIES: DUF4446 family protein [unclassified Oribacterium]SEA82153.1 Protein of unknown function [Oribacterium sp. KHPX15]
MFDLNIVLIAIAAGGLFVGILALIIAVRANVKYTKLYKQYDYFMRGKDAETLEDYFVELQRHVENLEIEDQKNKEVMRILNKNIRASFQKFGLIKYNAFGGLGGNMSFAVALLDYTNTGFVINSVHSREGCFLYIKDVDAGTTEVELGSEEKLALEQALGYREKQQ